MTEPARPRTCRPRLLAALVVAAALACGGDASSMSSSGSGITGTYAGTLSTTGLCGSGSVTITIFQGGMNLFGSWATSGFATASPCALNWSGGTMSGALVGSVVYLTLTQSSQAFRLAGTFAADNISGTFTQDFSSGGGVSPGGSFSVTKQ